MKLYQEKGCPSWIDVMTRLQYTDDSQCRLVSPALQYQLDDYKTQLKLKKMRVGSTRGGGTEIYRKYVALRDPFSEILPPQGSAPHGQFI